MALSDDCIAYYKLDTNNTTQPDATGNGNSGAVSGATYTSSGKINGSYDFDGTDDYVYIPDILGNMSSNFTLNFWISTNSTSDDIIFDKDYNGSTTNRLFIQINENESGTEIDGFFRVFSNDGTSVSIAPSTNPNISDGNWHMITFVRDTTSTTSSKIYVDGSEVSTTGSVRTGSLHSLGDNHNIGIQGDESSRPYLGKIDEIGIWERIVTSSEVLLLDHSVTT